VTSNLFNRSMNKIIYVTKQD